MFCRREAATQYYVFQHLYISRYVLRDDGPRVLFYKIRPLLYTFSTGPSNGCIVEHTFRGVFVINERRQNRGENIFISVDSRL